MATDAELRAAGIHLPSGSDYIREGDDAISANARVLWDRMEAQRTYRGLATAGLDTGNAPEGWYYIASGTVAEALEMPKRAQGWLGIFGAPPRPRMLEFRQTDIVSSTSLEVWIRTTNHNGVWDRPWHQTYPAPAASVVTHRHQLLSDEQFNAVGGVVHTDGATPVALTWDDWPADTRDLVVPMLRARGIKATLALPSRILTPERAPYLGGEGITWPEIDAWVSEGIFEIANHSATHMGASTPEGLRDEIETSLAELHQQLPSARVRCWIQPSVDYPGFDNGDSLDAWTRTEAGQLILDNHALATGLYRREPGVFSDPRLGRPVQGTGRTWIDVETTSAQAAIAALAGTGRGIIIGAHANRLTLPDRTTPAQLEAFLDWLVAEQDAGRVRLLTLSEWAWADVRPQVSAPYVGPWRDVTELLDPAAVQSASGFRVRRNGDRIEYSVGNLRSSGTRGAILAWGSLPPGYRPSWNQYGTLRWATGAECEVTVNTGGGLVVAGTAAGQQYRGGFAVYTTDAPPTTHPGDPA